MFSFFEKIVTATLGSPKTETPIKTDEPKESWQDILKRRKMEQQEQELKEVAETVRRCLTEMIKVDRQLTSDLRTLYHLIDRHDKNYKAKKAATIGANIGTSIIVGAGLIAAPFTGGSSLLLTTIGSAVGVINLGANLLIEEFNNDANRDFVSRLKRLAEQHDTKARELQQSVVAFETKLNICASENVPLNGVGASLKVALAVAVSTLHLSPTVRNYIQRYVGTFWSRLSPSIGGVGLATVGQVLLTGIVVVNVVATIIIAINEIKRLEEMHPLLEKVNQLFSDLNMEIDQLQKRLDCD